MSRGFEIIRPSGNVAAKIIRELTECLADVERDNHAREQRKGYAEAHQKLSL